MEVAAPSKNLLALNKHLEIHGIDISKESYQVAKRLDSDVSPKMVMFILGLEM